ncbi:MAG: PSD1 and planctomycete cytochrome C domain-containing protein, partial [Planctomycetota bacterium]|nr:PSD1 and planctomycete cytochrome C domain-containing protein [Planctomycetota bacterium]
VRNGGDSGPAIQPRDVERSLLITAVRQTTELKMPPKGKLSPKEVAALEQWVKSGAVWPVSEVAEDNTPTKPARLGSAIQAPNDPALAAALQLWLKADALGADDGAPVHVWPDQSGRGHDLAATKGVRKGGTGTPPAFVAKGRVNGRPAVRFVAENGMAGSPDHLLDIHGNAAITIFLVAQWTPLDMQPPYDNVLTIGNPAAASDPKKPWSATLEIDRSAGSLDLAGGWSHDAMLGRGSADLLYRTPRIITVTKTPGPMTAGTRFFFEGQPSNEVLGRELTGSAKIPDIQHRSDIGVYIGKAAGFSGHISGDYSEVIVYNRVLTDVERQGVHSYLTHKYGMLSAEMVARATRRFSDKEKSHWSFLPVRDPRPPEVEDRAWTRTPIDRFILAKLESAGLQPAVRADPTTLIRRVTYNLTGLPPTADEIEAFRQDSLPDPRRAFRKLIDRLLASPHYGERWGRHWLDVVRYADTTANDGNFVMRYAFRYRDYVVDSFNRDRPYDEFLTHQLAGDLLPDANPRVSAERSIATGFLMVGPKALAEVDKEQVRMDIVDEQIDATGRAMLGLTISCARCHDHKFDPIPTVDYYSIAGIFRSTEMFSDLVRNASKWMEYDIAVGDGKTIPVMAPKEGEAKHLRVHLRGSRFRLGEFAPRRFLQVLAGEGHEVLKTAASGRLELARWIASKQNPLTARVMVNRIWQGHFGRGLVATSGNFGTQGDRPSHPELLDWLAGRFMRSGWSVKALHRLVLNSAVWQQSSIPNPRTAARAAGVDAENRLRWKASRRRLDAEEVRDALLAFGNQLEQHIGGGEIVERLYNEGEKVDAKRGVSSASKVNSDWVGFDSSRRSIYLPVVRNGQPDVLALFDVADANAVTPLRNETTVSSQAAFLLNSEFSRRQAANLASELIDRFDNDEQRLSMAFLRVLGHGPTQIDRREFLTFLSSVQQSETEAGSGINKARLA